MSRGRIVICTFKTKFQDPVFPTGSNYKTNSNSTQDYTFVPKKFDFYLRKIHFITLTQTIVLYA